MTILSTLQFPTTDRAKRWRIELYEEVYAAAESDAIRDPAFLQHRIWRACKLRVHTVAEQLDNSVAVKANLQKLLQQVSAPPAGNA